MKFNFECPACTKTIKSDGDHVGRRGKCPECGAIFYVPSLPPHKDDKINQAVKKELLYADQFFENLYKVHGWRLPQVYKQAQLCRQSLDKAFALNGHTGSWILDLWVYIVNGLPWFVPATLLIPSLFVSLLGIVTSALSYTKMEQRIQEVAVESPSWLFYTTKTIVQQVVIEPVRYAPNFWVVCAIIGVIVLSGIAIFSYGVKHLLIYELRYRRRLLMQCIYKKESPHS